MPKLADVVKVRLDEIKAKIITDRYELPEWEMRVARHIAPREYEYLGDWCRLRVGEVWGVPGQTVFVRKTVEIPLSWSGRRVALRMETGGEGLLYVNGVPFHGIDDNRSQILLSASARGGEVFELSAELKVGGYLAWTDETGSSGNHSYVFRGAELISIDRVLEEAYFDFAVAHEAAIAVKDPLLQEAMLRTIKAALFPVDFRDKESAQWVEGIAESRTRLRDGLSRLSFADTPAKAMFTGHSHIDVAWLWPLRETVRKCGRTYSTVTALMDQYPDYHFNCSQVPLFLYTREYYPEVYEKIKRRVAEGRFEPIGGTWVEHDTNLVSGESLVRQCLYGQRFFMAEFRQRVRVGWLPDVFGYTWALPQVYKQAGIDYFMTSKIRWNDTNKFPFGTFWWEGIDGTRLFTHFLSGTYNANATPGQTLEMWDAYKSKLECPEYLVTFGFGDGGGGPTREMIEYIARMADLPGVPKATMGRVHDFFDRISRSTTDLPVWNGEFYLETHRGTYTTQARNKRGNRKSELLYRDAELLSTLAMRAGLVYPADSLRHGWETILLNQFHDVLPGSSVTAVYDDSQRQYAEIDAVGRSAVGEALSVLSAKVDTSGPGVPVVVFNTLSHTRSDVAIAALPDGMEGSGDVSVVGPDGVVVESQVSGKTVAFAAKDVPAVGYAVYHIIEGQVRSVVAATGSPERTETQQRSAPSRVGEGPESLIEGAAWPLEASTPPQGAPEQQPFSVSGHSVSTPFYDLTFDDDGSIERLWDKRSQREVIAPGCRANVLQLFEDKPSSRFEAWDIEPQYKEKVWGATVVRPLNVAEVGQVKLVLKVELQYGKSMIDQEIALYSFMPRIDFVTKVDWHERKTLMKVAFPVNIRSSRATYEIAYGTIERPTHANTSWDTARFEVSGHRWADLSEGGYGVSLLNDCKYGWDIWGNVVRLSLLRSPQYPDSKADQGLHEFTYALLPHRGDWREETVVEGLSLNSPLRVVADRPHPGVLGKCHSFISVDAPSVIVDAVKKAEDSDETVIRVYESHGGRGPVKMRFDRAISQAVACNILEEETGPVTVDGDTVSFYVRPYELKTFRIKFSE